ncbi:class I SAM-dependent methyltransferase [Apilactobacillus apisilvae]|uniref:Class I SAM-dependent methyltransferase n=1 Tax=Apilactobacillus apisilvae TaxID=2923364 RepID=A0ABY4PJA8_9LACO|nr:class I SAM-dependent methyltransferase [Apilactobacillus apisilvae]UQS85437.1 class I SAM-dependent methyltransferase [Apilactobacillus apisilvae]
MDANHLSQRLKKVSDYVPINGRLADIGSDHAYLPLYLMKNGKLDYAIASEVAKGPLQNAEYEINKSGLSDKIDTRLANGLLSIKTEDNINCVAIAGMGGILIHDILENGQNHLNGNETLILQPNVGESIVREWLMNNYYEITNEHILREDGHNYEIIEAKKCNDKMIYTLEELKFGPFLLAEKSDVFIGKWTNEINRLNNIISSMDNMNSKKPTDKINNMKKEIKEIKEVL